MRHCRHCAATLSVSLPPAYAAPALEGARSCRRHIAAIIAEAATPDAAFSAS